MINMTNGFLDNFGYPTQRYHADHYVDLTRRGLLCNVFGSSANAILDHAFNFDIRHGLILTLRDSHVVIIGHRTGMLRALQHLLSDMDTVFRWRAGNLQTFLPIRLESSAA